MLDEAFAQKMTPSDAKNHKKLLAAIQKCKILHPTEISVLFVKANRFLGKDAMRKEKMQIKKDLQEKVIVDGLSHRSTDQDDRLKNFKDQV